MKRGALFIGALAALYAGIFFRFDRFASTAVYRDEGHFWPTAFSFREFPTVERLRSYNELNTPLPFIVFGQAERFFHGGLAAGRTINFALSFLLLLMVGFARGRVDGASAGAAAALLLFPYFIGVSIHLYTDMMAAFFTVVGLAVHRSRRWVWSGVFFSLAVASRQYMVAFPAALAAWEAWSARRGDDVPVAAWAAPALGAATLAGWFLLWGGPAPEVALRAQGIPPGLFVPKNALYALSCLGAYYVFPEALLRRRAPWKGLSVRSAWGWVLGVGGLFLLFPPLENVNYFFPVMGCLDRACRVLLNDFFRMLFYAALAWAAAVRFRRRELASFLVWAHVLIMAKAHIAWDKYALAPLAALWWLFARDGGRVVCEETACPEK